MPHSIPRRCLLRLLQQKLGHPDRNACALTPPAKKKVRAVKTAPTTAAIAAETFSQRGTPSLTLTRTKVGFSAYWMPSSQIAAQSRSLLLRIVLRPFRQVADTWPLGPA